MCSSDLHDEDAAGQKFFNQLLVAQATTPINLSSQTQAQSLVLKSLAVIAVANNDPPQFGVQVTLLLQPMQGIQDLVMAFVSLARIKPGDCQQA